MLVKSYGRAIVEYQFIKCLPFPCASLSGSSDISFLFDASLFLETDSNTSRVLILSRAIGFSLEICLACSFVALGCSINCVLDSHSSFHSCSPHIILESHMYLVCAEQATNRIHSSIKMVLIQLAFPFLHVKCHSTNLSIMCLIDCRLNLLNVLKQQQDRINTITPPD